MLAAIAAGEDAVDPSDGPDQRGGALLIDKPDQGGFAARRITDKPDQGGYVASTGNTELDPCMKADGTRYLGTGTAVNPFAAGDPCLPRQTALAEVVLDPAPADPALAEAAPGASVADPPVTPVLAPMVRLRRPLVPPPPPVAVGSDYRG